MDAIILASSSPRRRELLSQAGIPFTVMPGEVDEEKAELSGTPEQITEQLAYLKAMDVAGKLQKGLVLGADTIVVCDGEIFGKPADEKDAIRMLRSLSGREHLVITAIALADAESKVVKVEHEKTKVKFSSITSEDIKAYIKTGEPFGKAGAYAVQGRGALLVESIDGCYSNVVGLPLFKLGNMLREFGMNPIEK